MSSLVATLSVILTILLCPAIRSVTGILIAIPLMYFLDIPFNWSVILALLPSSGFALFRSSPDHLYVFHVTSRWSSISTWLHGAPSPIRGTLAILCFVCDSPIRTVGYFAVGDSEQLDVSVATGGRTRRTKVDIVDDIVHARQVRARNMIGGMQKPGTTCGIDIIETGPFRQSSRVATSSRFLSATSRARPSLWRSRLPTPSTRSRTRSKTRRAFHPTSGTSSSTESPLIISSRLSLLESGEATRFAWSANSSAQARRRRTGSASSCSLLPRTSRGFLQEHAFGRSLLIAAEAPSGIVTPPRRRANVMPDYISTPIVIGTPP